MDDATAKVFEALTRIEHKVDCIIAAQGLAVPPMRDDDLCPSCLQKVQYAADFGAKAIVRICGCGHGKTAPMVGFKDVIPLIEGDKHGYDHALRRRAAPDYVGDESE